MKKVTYHRGKKFDLQLSEALINEKRLGDIFEYRRIEKIELKSETWQWEKTGNICLEYQMDGEPSGIAATEADYWVHELKRDGKTLVYLMFPKDRLLDLARDVWRKEGPKIGGDGSRFKMVTIPLKDILK